MRPTQTQIAEILSQNFEMLIDGQTVAASDAAVLASQNPATGERLGLIPDASVDDIERAVKAARCGQRIWAALSYGERRDAVLKVAELLRRHAEAFGILDTLETGSLFSAMHNDAIYAASAIDYMAAIGFEVKGESTQLDGNVHYTRLEPYGVVLRLLPFNHPLYTTATALAAPLLMGNSVILKPSPYSSMSSLLLGRLIASIFPPGVVTIITGSNERAARGLVAHPGIDRISLIGSTAAGVAVMKSAADRLLPLTLELGGKNPLIVLSDADMGVAVDTAIAGMNFGWQSASCGSTSRILVHKSRRAEMEARLVERLSAIRVGDPFDADTEMGAISFKSLYDRVMDYINHGKREGARLAVGGERPADADPNGLFVRPALFVDATPAMKIAREEIFGPIITMIDWDDWNAMIDTVNELPFGLTASIIGQDIDVVNRTVGAIQAGYVEINGPVSWALGSPFGGLKQSGFGREGNIEELLSYTYTKSVNVRVRG